MSFLRKYIATDCPDCGWVHAPAEPHQPKPVDCNVCEPFQGIPLTHAAGHSHLA